MGHGVKPYGRTEAQDTVFGVQDMGELTARLWSPNTFHRTGNTLFMDGFEGSFNKWIQNPQGLGAGGAISALEARSGLVSAQLTAGSTPPFMMTITHREPYLNLGSFGLEASFRLPTTCLMVQLDMLIYDGANATHFAILWRDVVNDLLYLTGGGITIPFAVGIDLEPLPTLFHTFKLVVDAVNAQYRYFLLNNLNFNLAGLPADVVGNLTAPYIRIQVIFTGRLGFNDILYTDDVIITQNEP